jgi:hypothetical protein
VTSYPESVGTFDLVASRSADWNRVLYVGWHPQITGWSGSDEPGVGNGDWYIRHIQKMRDGQPSVHTVIERNRAYFEKLKAHPLTAAYGVHCLNIDVVDYALYGTGDYDLIIWWHGPEHVAEADMTRTVLGLEVMCHSTMMLGGPEGEDVYEDAAAEDAHRCVLTRQKFEALGYITVTFERDKRGQGPHLSAYKFV